MPHLRDTLAVLLKDRKYEAVLKIARKDRGTVRTLMGLLYHEEELVRWRAVTMFGRLAAIEPLMVRPFVVRLLWSLSEESSIVGWGSAQALGEIARMNPEVAGGAARIVVHFPDDEELSRPGNRNTYMLTGSIWATGDLAEKEPALTREMVPLLVGFLDDPDPQVRAHSAWALGRVAGVNAAGAGSIKEGGSAGSKGGSAGLIGVADALRGLLKDEDESTLYIDEELVTLKVKDVAAGVLERLKAAGSGQ